MKTIFYCIILSLTSLSFYANAEKQSLTLKQLLLMQADVIEGHAEFEAQCDSCHESFNQQGFTQKCLDCHEDIAADREQKKGFHGKSPLSSTNNCDSCHVDHKGRDSDIINMKTSTFNHHYTNFILEDSHTTLTCDSCHKPEEKYREAGTACIDCHKDDDVHRSAALESCNTCHQPTTWQKLKPYDHSLTDFMLDGKHQEVPCMSCHLGQKFEFEQQECVTCHLAADIHAGTNGKECDSCHTTETWEQQKFDHSENTDFPLLGEHNGLPCRACHSPEQKDRADTPQACVDCHKNDDSHFGRYGAECKTCHTPESWTKSLFNHDRQTDFKLTGNHKTLACGNCHKGKIEPDMSMACQSCHASDNVHESNDMEACVLCHNTSDWKSTSQFDHEFTSFPLIGLHAIVPCENCHHDNLFSDTPDNCQQCHKQDDAHNGSLGEACGTCHNPNDWEFWNFNHNTQTSFNLDGGHEGVACGTCHLPKTQPQNTSQECVDCHIKQDIHKGTFGQDCASCHTTKRFSDVIWFNQ